MCGDEFKSTLCILIMKRDKNKKHNLKKIKGNFEGRFLI